ncbi:MAG: hypothetical protein DIZ80_00935 [endosymbiont of Galathealinum brachiosum]|uniref:DUF3187 domain-containing protein n=1 Tax=endosymbiont of Galathealinum brachiosum TaxID=2200906 RepID=A0A370DMC4_9GAMM|nr:MAG: hypothetical protein DIZ80_00935 [endosymbiont of Galathealinum brachiosum]
MKTFTRYYFRFFVLLLLTAIAQDKAYAYKAEPEEYWQGTLGPLTIRSLSPAQSLRLSPIPRSPYGLPDGQTELQFNIAAASVYSSQEGLFILDYHFTDTRFAINQGFANNWSAEFSINERRILNAHLDQLTLEFHDLFGIDQNGRDETVKDGTHIQIPEYGIDLGNEVRGQTSQTIGISVQKVLADKSIGWPAIAVNFNMSYEMLHDGLIEHGAFDYGVQFSIAQKKSNGYAYGNLSYTEFGSDDVLGLPLKDHQFSGMFGYEFNMDHDEAFILQYLFSEGVVDGMGELSEFSHEIHIGYKWRTESYLFEAGLVENIVNFENSPDVAFTFGVTYKL